jgi:quercetin dioxygenase-like cupin family protein
MEGTIGRMYSVVSFNGREWSTRPHEPGEPARHTSQLSDEAGFTHTRANLWRYEPGAKGRRHVHADQEETFLVLAGAMTMHVGEPPEPTRVSVGELIYGSPPDEGAEVLPDAI